MHEPFTTPMNELRILRKAFQLLVDAEQLTKDDELLIANQVRAVLTAGDRHSPRRPDANEDCPPFALDDEILPPNYAPDDTSPFPGFTVEERVCQLGYRLTCQQYAALIPALVARVRDAWDVQFHGQPAHWQDADWYGAEDRLWIDKLIHTFFTRYPAIVRREALTPQE